MFYLCLIMTSSYCSFEKVNMNPRIDLVICFVCLQVEGPVVQIAQPNEFELKYRPPVICHLPPLSAPEVSTATLTSVHSTDTLLCSHHLLNEREREMFYLTTHSTHFIYGYTASDIWLRTILIVRKKTRCRHIGYSYRLTARVLLYAPSHRQDNTYHGLCYTSRASEWLFTHCTVSLTLVQPNPFLGHAEN